MLARSVVYTSGAADGKGVLEAFDEQTGNVIWQSAAVGTAITTTPAVGGAYVYVTAPTGCCARIPPAAARRAVNCAPAWRSSKLTVGRVRARAGRLDRVRHRHRLGFQLAVRVRSQRLRRSDDLRPPVAAAIPGAASGLAASSGIVATTSNQGLFVYPAGGCAASSCTMLWRSSNLTAAKNPIVTSRIFVEGKVAASTGHPTVIASFRPTCPSGSCGLLWYGLVPEPTVTAVISPDTNDLYVPGASFNDGSYPLYVFRTGGCSGGSPCAPVWTDGPRGGADDVDQILLAGGILYVGWSSQTTSFWTKELSPNGCGAGKTACDPACTSPPCAPTAVIAQQFDAIAPYAVADGRVVTAREVADSIPRTVAYAVIKP